MSDDRKDDDRTVFQPPQDGGKSTGGGGSGDPFAPLTGGESSPHLPPPPPPPASSLPPTTNPSSGDPFGPLGGVAGSPPAGSSDPFISSTPSSPPTAPAQARVGQIAVGDVLNGIYRITRFIARGGMGEVYEGVNIYSAGERVAVKVMLSNLASDARVMEMFAKEASTLTRLHHEAIVPYRLAARDTEGRPFIVTEFVDGPSLEERLGSVRLTDEQFGELTRRLARGLGAAHALGAIHRDIAPDNVLLVDGDPERPKIIDFGIARDARDQTKTIVGDGFAGKLKYVAPEQLGEYGRRIGPWTDLYSLALTLLAVASGRHTDMGGSIADAVRKRMSVPDLSAIPDVYRPAFERALQPDPALRPQSMGDFITLLYEAKERRGGGFTPLEDRPRSQPPTPLPKKEHAKGGGLATKLATMPGGRWTAIGAAGALVLVLAIVGIVLGTSGQDEEPTAQVAKSDEVGPAPGPVEPGSQAFAVLASSLAASPACSWLTFQGADAGVATFVGGAGNPAASQAAIDSGLRAKGAGTVSLDMGEVVSFAPTMCSAIDAMREFRSPGDIITSPQRSYEAEEQDMTLANGNSLGAGKWAKPLFKVGGLRSDESLIFLVIEAGESIQPLFASRESGKEMVTLLSGTTNADGFDVPYPAQLEQMPKESYGIAVVAGKGPFPIALFGDPAQVDPRVPLAADWPERFRNEARAKGWRTDIFWFSVVDEVPG